jgi:high affinity sulfate transporter 1
MRSKQPSTRRQPLPLFQGLLPFDPKEVPNEIIAGVTLASLASPEVMGYTKIAGTPVITGLYTMLIPMLLFAVLGSSRHLVVGADSATAAILAAGLAGMAATGSAEYLALSALLALMAAGFLILARIVRLGFLADFLSRTVLVGFLTGVGVQVACSQLPGILGIEAEGHGVVARLADAARNIARFSLPTLIVCLVAIAVIIVCRRLSRRIPGPLIAVIGAIVLSRILDFESMGIAVLGPVPSGLPTIGIPDIALSWPLLGQLLPTAFSIFLVILAQSAATSRAYAARHNERFSENVDLVGLAAANIGAGLSGTFVVNGSPTKTAMVDGAGGRSQLAHLTACAIVLVVLLFLTGELAYLPVAVLSAVVFLIGLDLIDMAGMRKIYREARSEFWVALITTVVVVLVGVEEGILLAMALSLIDHTRRGYRPRNSVIVKNSSGGWDAEPVTIASELEPGLMVYRFSHSLYYANIQTFADEVEMLIEKAEPPIRWLCIDSAAIDDVDFSAAQTLQELFHRLHDEGVRLVLVAVSREVKAELDSYGLTSLLGQDAFLADSGTLINTFREAVRTGPTLADGAGQASGPEPGTRN